jgi:hypothetical protein
VVDIQSSGFIDTFEKIGATVLQMLGAMYQWIEKVLKRRTKHNRSLVQP